MSRSLLLAVVALLAACSSPYAADCAKAKECGELHDQTPDECSQDSEKCSDTQHSSGIAACVKLADALDDVAHCTASLSCEERASSASFEKCKPELQALLDATQAAAGAHCPDCN